MPRHLRSANRRRTCLENQPRNHRTPRRSTALASHLDCGFRPQTSNPFIYEGRTTITAEFQIHETFKEKNREALIRVSATSILYDAYREMLANLTARLLHGILSLPSISFHKSNQGSI